MKNVLMVAAAFAITFILNHQIFNAFVLDDYVSLVFIPSGVRIFSVLVFDFSGALGIFLGSLLVSYFYFGQSNVEVAVCAGLIAGGSALLSRYLCVRLFRLDVNLRNISLATILKICFVFSVLSSVGHQVFYQVVGIGKSFILDTVEMLVGDLTGAILFLIAVKYFLVLARCLR